MTSTELEKLVRTELGAAGLWEVVDQNESQFLEFPDGLFAELVLKDGSKLVDVERVAQELRERLRKQNIELDVIVRALWTVESVQYAGTALVPTGQFRLDTEAFVATLASGAVKTTVEVQVTKAAWEEIKAKLCASLPSSGGDIVSERGLVERVVREFLGFQLSLGGSNYWNPFRSKTLELNELALQYLLWHSHSAQALQRHQER